ncbi:helix-turn-helix transcriptional regulator [Oscillospiraceae bacterium OttesenSCG-928-G22]|nr:helix-turn-helix transcriptional regulator [Oscillospiraceae bacterium OttesenSCG-928-G22]
MAISYKKLWKILIDKDMKKKDLQAKAGVSSASITKLAKNESISTSILEKICAALECNVSDIMEIVPERNPSQSHVKDGTITEEE